MSKHITLYSTGCPKCKVLISKFNEKNIDYEICDDISIMLKKGITQLPVLDVSGDVMDFKKSVEWINNL